MKKIIVGIVMMTAAVSVFAQAIVTESTSNSTTNSNSKSETTVKSPPPSAIAPSVNTMNNDLCTVGVSGAAQTQILGIAIGSTFRDENCERLKLAKNLYDMGMKVAAVATLCQDERVFVAMLNAGTPCPINGKIGTEAKKDWDLKDLSAVDANKKLGTTGFYRAPIIIREEPKENKSPTPSCADYTGNDPIVRDRICK
jgi:hypothetical protein